jgi:GNAT superfamily N-acetyltransferase
MQSRGIQQWAPGDITLEQFEEQAAAGEWYLLRVPEPVGAVRLIQADPAFWGEQETTTAIHVHGLVTSCNAPRGTGALLLCWIEEYATESGCEIVRLDCLENNEALCRYYERQGYVQVGRQAFSVTSVALYEKPVQRG